MENNKEEFIRMKKIHFLGIIVFFFLAACTEKEVKQEPTDQDVIEIETPKETDAYSPTVARYYELENPGRVLTEMEQELLRYPGEFSGDAYDEAKVNEVLDQLPDNLTEEEYLEAIKNLLTEDYHEELATFVHFDSNVEVDVNRPDEMVDVLPIKTTHYAILIDASGSMKEMIGDKNRMEAAKNAVKSFAEHIPKHTTISMRVYGHKGSGSDADKKLSCTSTENFYGGKYESEKFDKALDKVEPAGWTPIGLALETVVEDIPEDTDETVVYVVSDGIETCEGDPVKAAKELASANIDTIVNIIGFDVDNDGQRLLKKVAKVGNGKFTYVDSEQDLQKYMKVQYEAIQKEWQGWMKESKRQANEQTEDKKDLAKTTQENMQKKVSLENERMEKSAKYITDKFGDTNDATAILPILVMDYTKPKNTYAIDMGRSMWSESYDSGKGKRNEINDEGHEKVNENEEKKNGQ